MKTFAASITFVIQKEGLMDLFNRITTRFFLYMSNCKPQEYRRLLKNPIFSKKEIIEECTNYGAVNTLHRSVLTSFWINVYISVEQLFHVCSCANHAQRTSVNFQLHCQVVVDWRNSRMTVGHWLFHFRIWTYNYFIIISNIKQRKFEDDVRLFTSFLVIPQYPVWWHTPSSGQENSIEQVQYIFSKFVILGRTIESIIHAYVWI